MSKHARKTCPQCRQLQQRLEAQAAEIKSLRAELLELREQLAAALKNSSTSSKPPSSDITKPPPPVPDPAAAGPRKIGGQPGHPKHEREPFPPEQLTFSAVYHLDACPCCGGCLRRNGSFAKVVQQIEIARPPLAIEQHTSLEYWCATCQRGFLAPLPAH